MHLYKLPFGVSVRLAIRLREATARVFEWRGLFTRRRLLEAGGQAKHPLLTAGADGAIPFAYVNPH